MQRRFWSLALIGVIVGANTTVVLEAAGKKTTTNKQATVDKPSAASVAAQVDRLLRSELEASKIDIAPRCSDEDFLRRVSFDITGRPPLPQQVTLFGLNPDGNKRAAVIDQLLASSEFGRNWGNYYRDVIFMNATNQQLRGGQSVFEEWIAEQLNANKPWDEIVTTLLTATGDIRENGATALFLAHQSQPAEVAAEACRIFLGIQIQCANCHDHPSDVWKRQQFHELAAYFPRTALRPVLEDGMQRSFEVVSVNFDNRRGGGGPEQIRENPERLMAFMDKNRDGKLSKEEAQNSPGGQFARIFELLLQNGDSDKDGMLSVAEMKKLPDPPMQRRGSSEYFMPDLKDPSSRGTQVNPKFFVDESKPATELPDLERRAAAAKAFTNPENPWFARAIINRLWHEMLGEGFYMPVDDLGPTRTARFPEVLDELSKGFIANKYDVKWLVKTIALTDTYQRAVRSKSVSAPELPFASQTPTHLRADQLFNALVTILGLDDRGPGMGGGMMAGPFAAARSPRNQFHNIFSHDPSTPQEDIIGNVQQALFMMNTPQFRGAVSATGNNRLGQIVRKYNDDQDAIAEVYLLALSREPSDQEIKVCQTYLKDTGNRTEAYEDILWSLLNSSEFLAKR